MDRSGRLLEHAGDEEDDDGDGYEEEEDRVEDEDAAAVARLDDKRRRGMVDGFGGEEDGDGDEEFEELENPLYMNVEGASSFAFHAGHAAKRTRDGDDGESRRGYNTSHGKRNYRRYYGSGHYYNEPSPSAASTYLSESASITAPGPKAEDLWRPVLLGVTSLSRGRARVMAAWPCRANGTSMSRNVGSLPPIWDGDDLLVGGGGDVAMDAPIEAIRRVM
eukprot:CAMPEP_0175061082 /NCGR_PEP_ID=MMETSP0052_2-20121109/13390_1 /TAXON_ID=51329 ORGANISM="Polytomella parva, Strain SAG 63-3" /NCGR_SAMPLE_ID=MMETSP0052_2 /ASSEMBLY_ACC=CAM_ASM_000194 /LENGTH=219 /DNA_ID=CAMNT_0016326903 /DNA_START=95 /DNA_END=751 /DNA_ORIENTATION=-